MDNIQLSLAQLSNIKMLVRNCFQLIVSVLTEKLIKRVYNDIAQFYGQAPVAT